MNIGRTADPAPATGRWPGVVQPAHDDQPLDLSYHGPNGPGGAPRAPDPRFDALAATAAARTTSPSGESIRSESPVFETPKPKPKRQRTETAHAPATATTTDPAPQPSAQAGLELVQRLRRSFPTDVQFAEWLGYASSNSVLRKLGRRGVDRHSPYLPLAPNERPTPKEARALMQRAHAPTPRWIERRAARRAELLSQPKSPQYVTFFALQRARQSWADHDFGTTLKLLLDAGDAKRYRNTMLTYLDNKKAAKALLKDAGDCAVVEGAQLHALLQPVSGLTAQAALPAEHEALAREWRTRIHELLGWLRNGPGHPAHRGGTEASPTDA